MPLRSFASEFDCALAAASWVGPRTGVSTRLHSEAGADPDPSHSSRFCNVRNMTCSISLPLGLIRRRSAIIAMQDHPRLSEDAAIDAVVQWWFILQASHRLSI